MGMVVTTAIWAVVVMLALWPPFRGGTLGFAVFVLTMTANEIPLFLLVVFVASTAITEPPAGAPATIASVILAAVSAIGLIWLQVRARTARPVLQGALDNGLGTGWRTSQRPDGLPATSWRPGILLPFERHTHGVHRTRNVSYGPERAHRLDLYRGAPTSGAGPVLVHLHGGGFMQGGKSRDSIIMLNQLAAHGWLCLSANYRLGSAGRHPNPLIDTKRVIAWIRDHAGEYGADPAHVFLAGCSAGGHLALSAALSHDRTGLQPGFEAADTSVAGVIVLYGYLGARTPDPSSSPALLARPDAPPMLIVNGANDTAVPKGTRAIAAALRRVSHNPVVLVDLPHTQHDFDVFASVRARVAADAAEAFLNWARNPRR